MHTIETQESVGPLFFNDTMEAFVVDFFATLGVEVQKDTKLLDMYQEIFKNIGIFKEFLRYAQENNFSFLENQETTADDRVIYMYICNFLRRLTLEKIEDILGLSRQDLKDQMSKRILGGTSTFGQALEAAMLYDIPLNSRGEVLYFLAFEGENYRVFSYESGLHEVDTQGNILRENIQNKQQRRIVLKKLQKYRRFLEYGTQEKLEDESDRNLMKSIMQEFTEQYKIQWSSLFQDPKELALHTLKLRFYVHSQISHLEKIFQELQVEEKQYMLKGITLIGGTDLGDEYQEGYND